MIRMSCYRKRYELNKEKELIDLLNKQDKEIKNLKKENEQLKKEITSKQRVIEAYDDYVQTLKEDGVLDD